MRTLTGMRRDPLPVQVCAAVIAFGALTAAAAAQPQWQDVIRNLRHPEARTRLDAVERLGRANYVAAVEPLVPLIRDPDDRVQAAAIDAQLTFFLSDRISDRHIVAVGGSKSRAQLAFEGGPLAAKAGRCFGLPVPRRQRSSTC